MGGWGSGPRHKSGVKRQADGSFRLRAPPAWMVEESRGVYRFAKGFRVFCDIAGGVPTLRFLGGPGAQYVELEATPSNLRGVRYWWLCPYCPRRCLKLYLPPRSDYFACRVCHELSYESAQSSRQRYYELFKSCARRYFPNGPQGPYLRSIGVRPLTATYFRESFRGAGGHFTVAPYEGEPEPLD